ncbi:MAG: hypothetical protein ACOZNI_21590 [Myxococcota bacterium]
MVVSLEAELEGALADAVGGDPPGPHLAKRLERIAREILLRRRLGAARVVAHSDARETWVQVLLPAAGPKVHAITVRVDSPLG